MAGPERPRDAARDEDLGPGTSTRAWWWLGLIAGTVALLVVVVRVTDKHDQRGSAAPTSARSASRPSGATSSAADTAPAPSSSAVSSPAPLRRYPRSVVRAAITAACSGACTARTDPRLASSAVRALGPVRDLQALDVTGGARIVAVLAPSGAQILVVASRTRTVDPTALGIPPPIGVQRQHNGSTLIVAVVSGSPDAISLLSRPRAQYWLARVRAG